MRTIVFFTFCFITCCVLDSCNEKKDCSGFPEHLADYYPYKAGETLSFVNQHDDTVSFRVGGVDMTMNHSIEKCGKCACEPPAFYFGATESNQESGFEGTISLWGYPANPCITFKISNNYWNPDFEYSSILIFVKETEKDPLDTKNNALFGETVIIEDENQQVSKVTIIKGKGVTEFYDQKHDFHWKNIKKKSY